MNTDEDFEYEYEKYMNEQRKTEIKDISKRYDLPEKIINGLISDYEFGGFIDSNKIKKNLSKEVVKREKEANNFSSSIRTKNNIAKSIVQFVKDLIIKYM